MEEKKYLKWYNKVGYGSGDLAANMVYGLLTSFVLIYLTDTVGLNAGIVGTLMMFSKFADGVTDVFFGTLIDKTHSKMGKARPWMLWSYLGNAVMLIAIFAIPKSMGDTAKYAYFFITYTLLNAVFYTANNIAYASLTSLITKNGNERVQMGSIRFMFSLATNPGGGFHYGKCRSFHGRRRCRLEKCRHCLCHHRPDCEYHFRAVRKRASGGRNGKREADGKYACGEAFTAGSHQAAACQ